MTSFKNYLRYRLKSSFLSTVSFSLIALIVTITVASDSTSPFEYDGFGKTGIESLATIMCIFASIIPMMETDLFKNRRNLDTLYFLPISRKKMALAHYLSGLTQLFTIYTVAFLGHFLVIWKYADHFKLGYLPLYYVLLLIFGVAVYSIFIFIYGEANSTVDGIIFSLLWIFAIYLLSIVANEIIKEYAFHYIYKEGDGVSSGYYAFTAKLGNFSWWFVPYTSVNNLTVVFQNVMEGVRIKLPDEYNEWARVWPTFADVISERFPQWYMSFLTLAAGAASTFGYFRTFTRKGAEKAGEVSDSRFGYKSLIPIYGFSCYAFTSFFSIMSFLVLAGMYLAYAIYRKSFKIKKTDVFAMIGTAAVSMIALLVATLPSLI